MIASDKSHHPRREDTPQSNSPTPQDETKLAAARELLLERKFPEALAILAPISDTWHKAEQAGVTSPEMATRHARILRTMFQVCSPSDQPLYGQRLISILSERSSDLPQTLREESLQIKVLTDIELAYYYEYSNPKEPSLAPDCLRRAAAFAEKEADFLNPQLGHAVLLSKLSQELFRVGMIRETLRINERLSKERLSPDETIRSCLTASNCAGLLGEQATSKAYLQLASQTCKENPAEKDRWLPKIFQHTISLYASEGRLQEAKSTALNFVDWLKQEMPQDNQRAFLIVKYQILGLYYGLREFSQSTECEPSAGGDQDYTEVIRETDKTLRSFAGLPPETRKELESFGPNLFVELYMERGETARALEHALLCAKDVISVQIRTRQLQRYEQLGQVLKAGLIHDDTKVQATALQHLPEFMDTTASLIRNFDAVCPDLKVLKSLKQVVAAIGAAAESSP